MIYESRKPQIGDYITSSIIRFGGLRDYIQEKMMVDYFAIQGNLGIAHGTKIYIENQQKRLESLKQIRILDVGPAIGAITGMLILQELGRANPDFLKKAKLILVDVSERVIEHTQSRNFPFPDAMISAGFKSEILTKLRTSKGIVASCHELPIKINSIDFCAAGFLFHHLHDDIKKASAKEIQRVLKPGGFVGIAEEWFENYEEYRAIHAHDEIPLAYESIISSRRLRLMFPQLEFFESKNPSTKTHRENYYYFCGIKKRNLGIGPRALAKDPCPVAPA